MSDRQSRLMSMRRSIDGDACSIKRTLDIVGEPWSLLILREAFWGATRFKAFQELLQIPRAVLAKRLALLTDAGIFERRQYQQEGARPRDEYVLTPAGSELLPALVALMQWGDRHLGQGPVQLVDAARLRPIEVRLTDASGKTIDASAIKTAVSWTKARATR
jgi:DNA-binding HxlR family transcriptional regulator